MAAELNLLKSFWPESPSSHRATATAIRAVCPVLPFLGTLENCTCWPPCCSLGPSDSFWLMSCEQRRRVTSGTDHSIIDMRPFRDFFSLSLCHSNQQYFQIVAVFWDPQVRMTIMWTRDPCLSRIREKARLTNLCCLSH